ncbi:1,2-phenylacetyl-CoA epoxidase subunit PaaD [Planobispora siamensis]|uniref:Phenylacetate-CoA oxygenase subunit PaaJ n=1 Tax=Planobispora siamensis TaxID=936338 RepID=A0A8J3SKP8_9ACTN|nr:1,2-phenylacetyl-CoA epoxidase subunit PaaD [Planobispora siamensis]GIH94875.1 phenylacetate-CoA oxygenase subunit PaaJ [Planobispora siamensis]
MVKERVEAAVAAVPDPELQVLSIGELGMLREVSVDDDGNAVVTLTPTYLGCPALELIKADVAAAARAAGAERVEVVVSMSPPWTTDWLSQAARAKLTEVGIAPPGRASLPLLQPGCPRCAFPDTEELSSFGAAACMALRLCPGCGEPFEHLKAH